MISDVDILENLKYCRYYAKKYRTNTILFEDLVQEGVIGLLKAKQKFDPGYNVKFITYAKYWIKNAIEEYVHKNKQIFSPLFEHQAVTFIDYEQYVDDQIFLPITLKSIEDLDSRTKDIILEHNMKDVTYTDLGKKYNISSERIKQLETRGITTIYNKITNKK